MITRVTIKIDVDSDTYGDRSELESLVIDELTDLMRSDIMAGARVDTIPLATGARVDLVPNVCAKCGDTVASHNLYGCCAEPLESSLSCGNSYRKCMDCEG